MGLLDLFNGGGATPDGGGMMGLLSPQDRFLAAMQALSHMGAAMAQPGQSRSQALANAGAGLTSGLQSGMQNALMQNIMLGNVQNTLAQRKAQQAYINSLPEDQRALAASNPGKFFETVIDRSLPKRAEIPFGAMVDLKTGAISLAPGMADYLSQRSGAEAGGRVTAERTVQNAVPLTTESPEFKGRVAGEEARARGAVELQNAGPLARSRVEAENPGMVSRAIQIAQGTGQTQNNALNNAGKLRDDFSSLSPVKAYREAGPIYQSMVETAPRGTKASDLNLVYGLAKIFDPNSVVREGEMVMVKNTSSLPDWLIGSINGLNGGAQLQPETRTAIMSEAKSRMDSYKNVHDAYAEQFGQMADRYGIPRSDVIVQSPPPPGAPTVASSAPASSASPHQGADPLAEARAAISRGAPRDAVIKRLTERGINPSGL